MLHITTVLRMALFSRDVI